MWAARKKASGAVRSRVRPSSRWRLNSAGAASGASAFGASRTSPPRACWAFLQEAVEPGAKIHTDGWRGYAGLPAAGYRHQVTVISGGSEPAHDVYAARPQSRRPAQTVVVGEFSRAASSTNISTTTSMNSPSASIGVDHRPEASCSTASSSRRWPSDRPPTTPSSHPGYLPISPNWGNERGYPLS